jgi:D-ribose pyranase
MLKTGILNPHVLSLIARVRHTNTLVIADRGFPSWPGLETIDLSLIDDVPTVVQVIAALRPNFVMAQAWMAEEFRRDNSAAVQSRFAESLAGVPIAYEPHVSFKQRVPRAVGLIRTGDTVQFANVILESG